MKNSRLLSLLLSCGVLLHSSALAAPQASIPASLADPETAFVQAVELARQGKLNEALPTLKLLTDTYPNNERYFYDYAVILTWAGRPADALDVYDAHLKKKSSLLPVWVKQAIAGACYQIGRYEEALELYSAVLKSGDAAVRVNQAETFIQLGQDKNGEALFDTLMLELGQGSKEGIDLTLRRAAAWEKKQDYAKAAYYYQAAHEQMTARGADKAALKPVTVLIIRSLIRTADYKQVAQWAEPYLQGTDKDILIQSDLILANRLAENYSQVVKKGKEMWPAYDGVPEYGLQALGDSFLHLDQHQNAIKVYDKILQQNPSHVWARLGRAYAFIQIGKVDEALPEYAKVLAVDPSLAEVLTGDCDALLRKGSYHTAERLFQVIEKYAGQSLPTRVKYANSLLGVYQPRAAFAQYEIIAALPDGDVVGRAGMARAALMVGDNQLAQSILASLSKDSKNPIVMQVQDAFNHRYRGSMDTSFITQQSHKKLESDSWRLSGDSALDGNLSATFEVKRTNLRDVGAGESTTLDSIGIGFAKVWMDDVLRVWGMSYQNSNSSAGFKLSADHYFNDRFAIGFGIDKSPLEDVQALAQGLHSTTYSLAATRWVGSKDKYRAGYSSTRISDSNVITGYWINWDHTWFDISGRTFTSGLYASRAAFRSQDINGIPTSYESPVRRERLGISYAYRWTISPKQYWQLSGVLGWERDLPDPLAFSPTVRLEYGIALTPNSKLIAGMEYGLYTPVSKNSLYYASRQYDLSYRVYW